MCTSVKLTVVHTTLVVYWTSLTPNCISLVLLIFQIFSRCNLVPSLRSVEWTMKRDTCLISGVVTASDSETTWKSEAWYNTDVFLDWLTVPWYDFPMSCSLIVRFASRYSCSAKINWFRINYRESFSELKIIIEKKFISLL